MDEDVKVLPLDCVAAPIAIDDDDDEDVGVNVDDVKVESIVENELLYRSDDQSVWPSKKAKSLGDSRRSLYKCPEKRDLLGFQMFHGRAPSSILRADSEDSRKSRVGLKKLRPIPSILAKDWKETLLKNVYVRCPWRECKRVFVTLAAVGFHYRRCEGSVDSFVPSCESCQTEFESNDKLISHLKSTPDCSKTPSERLAPPSVDEIVGDEEDDAHSPPPPSPLTDEDLTRKKKRLDWSVDGPSTYSDSDKDAFSPRGGVQESSESPPASPRVTQETTASGSTPASEGGGRRRSRRRAAEEARQCINHFANRILKSYEDGGEGAAGEEEVETLDDDFDFRERIRSDRPVPESISTREEEEEERRREARAAPHGDLVRPLYSVPELPEIPEQVLDDWKKESHRRRTLVCPHAGCAETYISLLGARQHYFNCPYGPFSKPQYACLVCGRLYGTEPGVRYHVKRHHSDMFGESPDEGFDVKPNVDPEGIVREATPTAAQSTPTTRSSHPFHSDLSGKSPYVGPPARGSVEPLPEALAWTLEYHRNNLSESELFPDWLPQKAHWKLLSEDDYDRYMPAFPVSMQFVLSDVKNGDRTPPQSLNLFESVAYDQGALAYTGGPVCAADWAPVPLEDWPSTQYFAVAGTSHVDVTHFVSKVYVEPGIVQIYGCLNLDVPPPMTSHRKSRVETYIVQPIVSLSLAIAHDYGAVWEMKWCPSGAYQHLDGSLDDSSGDDVLPRLGLLACACSDGTIRIFSIPHPSAVHRMIQMDIGKDDFISICKVTEVVTLSPSTDAKAAGVLGQCLCLDWSPLDAHRRLVGGFARGAVAVWDLTTTSPLLILDGQQGPTIFPRQCFLAHLEQVQSVRIGPSAGDILATVSSDRLCRLWNVNSVDVPLNEIRRGLMTDAQWLFYWNGILVAQDDCFNMEHNAAYFLECGYWGHQPRLLTPHNGAIWSLAASSWLNTVVSADSSGEVVGAVLPQMITSLTNHKPFSKRRFCVYRIELEEIHKEARKAITSSTANDPTPIKTEPLSSPSHPPPSDKRLRGAKSKSGRSRGRGRGTARAGAVSTLGVHLNGDTTDDDEAPLPKSFSEYIKRYRMVFHLYDPVNILTGRDSDRLKFPNTMSATRPDSLPVKSVNRVAWNPNLGSHCWLLTGLLSGFVQLSCISSLHTPMARKMFSDVKLS